MDTIHGIALLTSLQLNIAIILKLIMLNGTSLIRIIGILKDILDNNVTVTVRDGFIWIHFLNMPIVGMVSQKIDNFQFRLL
jgi:hypothetical protein